MAGLPELRSRTARISADFSRGGIRHAVSGAVAMTAHGVGRSTFDIDILVVVPSVRLPDVFAAVRNHGFSGDDRALLESLRDRYVAVLESGPIKVEVLVPVLPYHRTLVDRAVVRDEGPAHVAAVEARHAEIADWLRKFGESGAT